MPQNPQKLLLNISSSCEEINLFTEGKSFEDFKADRLLQLALERQFEILVRQFTDWIGLT